MQNLAPALALVLLGCGVLLNTAVLTYLGMRVLRAAWLARRPVKAPGRPALVSVTR